MIKEPSHNLPMKGNYEVVVIGGGVAGVAASVAAAREGKKVCLVEREYALGGLATLGIIAIYLPLCDGMGHQVIGGLSEELLKESIKYGSGQIPECWRTKEGIDERSGNRYKVRFDPPAFSYSLDKLITQYGIQLMFGTWFSDVIKEDKNIKYLILENKEGRFAIQADMIIDASGDADVCFACKEKTAEYNENRQTGWYYSLERENYNLNIVNDNLYDPVNKKMKLYGGIKNEEITQFCIDSREMMMKHKQENRTSAIITQIPTIPQLRMTRRLVGRYELIKEDERKKFVDAVGMFGDWRKAGPVYYLPFSCMIGITQNLIAAGRCISAKGDAWDITRAIPVCALTGEIAGVAAALKLKSKSDSIQSINLEELKNKMILKSNIIDESFIRGE